MLTRRRLFVPLAALTVSSAFSGALAARRRVMSRPLGSGTSATRCAQCGGPGHSMLDRRCPAAPRVI